MVKLITSQEIKLNTPLGGNVDPDKYLNFIEDTQIMVLEPILGTKLFDKIITDFEAGTLAGLYLQMFDDYIKPVMWHSVFAEYVKVGTLTVGNGGIYRHISDDAQLASEQEINMVVKSYQSKADTYIGRLQRFLCDQDSNIPEYTSNQDENYDIDPKYKVQTISGWYLQGSEYNTGRYDKNDWRIDEN